jgi:hypothetical protein
MSSTGSSSLGTADIIGIAIGGVFVIITLIGLIFSCYTMCCKKNNQAQVWTQPGPYYPPNGAYGQQMNTGYYPQQPAWNKQPINTDQQPPWNKQPTNNEQPPAYSSVYPGSN